MNNIFIMVYHIVRTILLFPVNLIKNIKNKQLIKEVETEKQAREARHNIEYANENVSSDENLIRVNGTDADGNSEEAPKITFNYVVVNNFGQTIKSSFEAATESEVRAFLINEGYKIVSITAQKGINWNLEIGSKKLTTSELTFALTQLSTYIRAGIPLIDSVRILAKQTTSPNKRKVYERIVYDLVTGESFSKALEKQNSTFPRLLINMIKTAEMTGDLPSVLDEMSEYYEQIEKTKKQMLSALIYPAVILIVSVVVVVFCLMYVVPSFVSMYSSSGASLPAITAITLSMSEFLQKNYIIIIAVIAFIAITFYLTYRNVKSFRRFVQMVLMKTPVIGNIIIYSEVSMFTKTFSSLINHNVNITQSMDVLSKISNNELYKEIIQNTIETLKTGGKISESFRGKWEFPVVAYEMLVTGESTGQLGLMMNKISEHYSNLHKTAIAAIKSLIEPITILFLAGAVGFILVSMFVPMFGVYNTIQ